jgi:uncharacterized membrane protein YhaH (DUF805 family)
MTELMSSPHLLKQDNYPILAEESDQPWSHRGRFGRLSYMAWVMMMALSIVAAIILMVNMGSIAGVTFIADAGIGFILMGLLCLIPVLYFMIIFQIRRLHDLNHSGLWVTLPLANVILAQLIIALTHSVNLDLVLTGISLIINIVFLLYLMIAEGTNEINDYGDRRLTPQWENVTGWISVAISAIGLISLILTAIPTYQNYQKQTAMMQISMQPSYQFPENSALQ